MIVLSHSPRAAAQPIPSGNAEAFAPARIWRLLPTFFLHGPLDAAIQSCLIFLNGFGNSGLTRIFQNRPRKALRPQPRLQLYGTVEQDDMRPSTMELYFEQRSIDQILS